MRANIVAFNGYPELPAVERLDALLKQFFRVPVFPGERRPGAKVVFDVLIVEVDAGTLPGRRADQKVGPVAGNVKFRVSVDSSLLQRLYSRIPGPLEDFPVFAEQFVVDEKIGNDIPVQLGADVLGGARKGLAIRLPAASDEAPACNGIMTLSRCT